MSTGPEMLESVRHATRGRSVGSEHWIDTTQKLDLCKLTVSDLMHARIDEKIAEELVTALKRRDIEPLGKALGISLRVKFKIWAERHNDKCTIRCDGADNAAWLRQYLSNRFADFQSTDPVALHDRIESSFVVTFTAGCTPHRLLQALTDCPATFPMRMFSVSIPEQPHFTIRAATLADWLDSQGNTGDDWWIVDGDPTLMSRVSFPAPPDELAREFRRINKPLLVRDPGDNGRGEELTTEDIPNVSEADEWGNRRFLLRWKDVDTDWELIEDELGT